MKKFLVGAALVAGTVSTVGAQAADLPRAPVYKAPPPVQVYNWTGFYIGVNAGLGIGRNETRLDIPAGPAAAQSHLSPFGAVGGGQIGYNYQFGSWVIGLEADIQAADLHDSACLLGCGSGLGVTYDQKLDWFGTVRGRIGLATGPVLSYVTGGFAYGGVKTSISETFLGQTGTFDFNNGTETGFTLGSGVEAALGGNWTGKIEYLYLDLGDQSLGYTFAGIPHGTKTEIREHIFRGGLNYRFGGNGSTAPMPLANWTGFYLGGNGGSAYGRNESSLAISVPPGPPILNDQFTLAPEGFIGGGQIGYNWQAGAWVFGVEADIQGSTQKDDKACVLFCQPALAATLDQKMPWFATARGRIGYSIGSTLFYATGGFAYGETKTRIDSLVAGQFTSVKTSRSKGGWAAGAGIESPFQFFDLFGPNWTVKSEYLFVDLGSSTDTYAVGPAQSATFTTKAQEHIFRTGINYHFNTPLAARY